MCFEDRTVLGAKELAAPLDLGVSEVKYSCARKFVILQGSISQEWEIKEDVVL